MLRICVLLALFPVFAAAGEWDYRQQAEKMSGKNIGIALLASDNSLALDYPYAGENRGYILVRAHPKHGTHAIVGVQQGQILCSPALKPCRVFVKFDDAAPKSFRGIAAQDHSSTTIALDPPHEFIAAARKATKILVQLPMYQAGEPILEFSTPKGLVWDSVKK